MDIAFDLACDLRMFRLKCCSLATSYSVYTSCVFSLHTAADMRQRVETIMKLSNVFDVAKRRGRWSAVVCVAVLGSRAAMAAPPAACDMRPTVEPSLGVPNPRDEGFLSSLLGNHPGYELTLRRQRDDSVIVVELSGPGLGYRCDNVVETMRKDARVLSVKAH
jgi:hypothetical protein